MFKRTSAFHGPMVESHIPPGAPDLRRVAIER